jgi:hypothetical protein
VEHRIEGATLLEKPLRCVELDRAALAEDENLFVAHDRLKAMGDSNDRGCLELAFERLLKCKVGGGIDTSRGLIEDNDTSAGRDEKGGEEVGEGTS